MPDSLADLESHRATIQSQIAQLRDILEKLAAGETVEQVLDAHPRLNEDAVRAALAFAADALRADVIYPLETILSDVPRR